MNPAGNPGEAFEAFRALATGDPELLRQFDGLQDIEAVAARAVDLGRERDLVFTPRQVREAWSVASKSWWERRAR